MRWFSYDPEDGLQLHTTAEEARAAAEAALEWCRDAANDDEWAEEAVVQICWGEVREVVEQTEHGCPRCSMRAKPGDLLEHEPGFDCEEDEVEEWIDYGLVPVREVA